MAHKTKVATLVLVMGVFLAGCVETRERNISKAKLTKEIRRKYENPEAHYELGKLYLADGLWDKAEWEFNVTLGFAPIHRRAQAAIVKTLLASNNRARASLTAEMYMNQVSTSAESSLILGRAFQNEQLDEYAMACYQQALGLSPNAAVIHKQIGFYYLAKGNKVRAEESLRRSFQLDPYQPEVAGELGRLGVIVQIPRKTEKPSKKLDKALEEGEK